MLLADHEIPNLQVGLLERLFESVQTQLAYLDPASNFLAVNRAFAAASQRDPSFFAGKNYFDLFPSPAERADFEAVLRTGEPRNDYALRDFRAAAERFCDRRIEPVKDRSDRVRGLLVSYLDVSRARRAELAAATLEARFRAFVEHSFDLVVVVNGAGIVTYASPAARRAGGYEASEIVGHSYLDFVHPDQQAEARAKFLDIRRNPDLRHVSERRLRCKDGSWLELEVVAKNAFADPAVNGVVINAHDISERNRAIVALRKSLEDTVAALAATVELRDPYTAGHQHRVADLSERVARELGLPEEDIRGLRLAAAVHDLGKIRIPAEILNRPGKLSDLEFELVKTHAVAGYEILKDIAFPWPIARIVLEHHERIDGSGYPQRLTGDAILIESRIVAVADVVEAMSSDRPYRKSCGLAAAIDELRSHRGCTYDADVVDACLKVLADNSSVCADSPPMGNRSRDETS